MVLDTGMGGHLIFLVHISHPKSLDSCTTEPEQNLTKVHQQLQQHQGRCLLCIALTCQKLQPAFQIMQLNCQSQSKAEASSL